MHRHTKHVTPRPIKTSPSHMSKQGREAARQKQRCSYYYQPTCVCVPTKSQRRDGTFLQLAVKFIKLGPTLDGDL